MEDIINCENNPEKIYYSVLRPLREGFLADFRNKIRWYTTN